MHVVAFMLAIPGGVLLIVQANGASATVGASIYAVSLILGFGTSAGYHRLARRERTQSIMQRLDHSMIFVLIAGSYTPICLLGLPTTWGIPLLCVVWVGAVLGILLKQLAFERLRILEYALYPILGWIVVIAAPQLMRGMSPTALALLLAGGVLYTVGIPVLARERPNPWPGTFGYHEIWHTFTVAAGTCHFVTIGLLVRG
ncbi:MAG: hemolysin III family protein [Actinomycetia bacterium]|nr:hemolysin III family protein [Actinomycetes bacterium]